MERKPKFPNLIFFLAGLILILLLPSCKEPGQANGKSAEEETRTPTSNIPNLTLSSKYLDCPSIPTTFIIIPSPPHDEQVGDCALIGRTEEIETWLNELEAIAESCRATRESKWSATLATREHLDAKIDMLQEGHTFLEACDYPGLTVNPGNAVVTNIAPTHYYTNWLMVIRSDVEKYCNTIDEIVKPLWQACTEINFYQDCQAPNPVEYHLLIKWGMNSAQAKYDQTDSLYTHLQTWGWDEFRTRFYGTTLYCPRIQHEQAPTFYLSKNAFCRIGPSQEYEIVATFLDLSSVKIDGLNQDDPRWWWVLVPDSDDHCWVSDSTGSAVGILEDLEIIAAPPLVIEPVDNQPGNNQPNNGGSCSADLVQSACASAGGTWTTSTIGPPYCDCK